MEPISLFLLLQKPTTFPYPGPDHYSPDPFPSYFFKKHFNIPAVSRSSGWFFHSGFPTKLYASFLPPLHATWPAHLILHLITQITSDVEYKSLRSSLCSLLHSPVTSPHLGTNIFLSTLFSHTLSLYITLCDRTNFTPIQNSRQNYSL